jgi:hypothetical protein
MAKLAADHFREDVLGIARWNALVYAFTAYEDYLKRTAISRTHDPFA